MFESEFTEFTEFTELTGFSEIFQRNYSVNSENSENSDFYIKLDLEVTKANLHTQVNLLRSMGN